jgi:hypothetical protein
MDPQWWSVYIAGAAVLLTIVTFVVGQVDRRKANDRLIKLEEARGDREAEAARRESEAAASAEPRIESAVMEIVPHEATGYRLTLVNRGAATALGLVVGARLAGLTGSPVEPADGNGDPIGGFLRVCDDDTPDVASLLPGASVELIYFYAEVMTRVLFRIAWKDALGAHYEDQDVTVRRPGD